jgi:signal-transduction protein with cAMP-binding, CBS, and nucleotidyltransferase domain
MESSPHSPPQLDSFPYRHRVSDLMASPLVTLGAEIPLIEASRWMVDHGVSSVVVLDQAQHPQAILTERDLLRAVARHGPHALDQPISTYASAPVATIRGEAFIYIALGRMSRLKIRHLVCVDARGRAIGMATAGALLAQRAGDTLRLGDQIAAATGPADLAAVRAALPGLTQVLLDDQVPALTVSAVISGVMRDLVRRSCQLTEMAMRGEKAWAAPPVAYAVLVSGAAGRAECGLGADIETALVYDGGPDHAAWFREFTSRVCAILETVGCPLQGAEQATRSLSQWEETLTQWIDSPGSEVSPQVAAFFDYVMVHGDIPLAGRLRRVALGKARQSKPFLAALTHNLPQDNGEVGLFDRLKSAMQSHSELTAKGIAPLVEGARILALHQGSGATSTIDRLADSIDHGMLSEEDFATLKGAYEALMALTLHRQTASTPPPAPLSDPLKESHRLSALVRAHILPS